MEYRKLFVCFHIFDCMVLEPKVRLFHLLNPCPKVALNLKEEQKHLRNQFIRVNHLQCYKLK